MAIVKVIVTSALSFDDAVKQGAKEVSKSVRNLDSIYVKDMKVHVKDGEIVSYGSVGKVSFRV